VTRAGVDTVTRRNLYIIGAGGFGREVFRWARDIPTGERDWEVRGFLDSKLGAQVPPSFGVQVIGSPELYAPKESDCFVCAIGDPRTRLSLCRSLESRGFRFITIIHPTSIVGDSTAIGRGVILCPYTIVTCNVRLGPFVIMNIYASVGHDSTLGDGCMLGCYCQVSGLANLGEAVFMGNHATVLPSAVVGARAVVGAGSVVLRRVKADSTVMGVPAKHVYSR
jgi:sugar O-acyltransferase (sialic acid O-acetyltransferase NeuD family)